MHELGIAKDLFQIIKRSAETNNLRRVSKIEIVLGVASGIEEDLLTHSLIDHILPGTLAQGAKLEIIKEPIKAQCRDCGERIDLQDEPTLTCPSCGNLSIEVIAGKDVYIKAIEGI